MWYGTQDSISECLVLRRFWRFCRHRTRLQEFFSERNNLKFHDIFALGHQCFLMFPLWTSTLLLPLPYLPHHEQREIPPNPGCFPHVFCHSNKRKRKQSVGKTYFLFLFSTSGYITETGCIRHECHQWLPLEKSTQIPNNSSSIQQHLHAFFALPLSVH